MKHITFLLEVKLWHCHLVYSTSDGPAQTHCLLLSSLLPIDNITFICEMRGELWVKAKTFSSTFTPFRQMSHYVTDPSRQTGLDVMKTRRNVKSLYMGMSKWNKSPWLCRTTRDNGFIVVFISFNTKWQYLIKQTKKIVLWYRQCVWASCQINMITQTSFNMKSKSHVKSNQLTSDICRHKRRANTCDPS